MPTFNQLPEMHRTSTVLGISFWKDDLLWRRCLSYFWACTRMLPEILTPVYTGCWNCWWRSAGKPRSTLNEVSLSAQTASLVARTELLDDHMLDSNWKKIINQGMLLGILQDLMWLIYTDPATSVVQKYQTAIPETEESEHYYQGLCENLDSRVQKQ